MKRSRLKPIGKRKLAEMDELREFSRAVLERANHLCERCFSGHGLHAHHRLPKSRGGTNEPENGVCFCWRCHDLCHSHAVFDRDEWID